MPKTKKEAQQEESEDAIMQRMNKALKKMLEKPHETQKQMVARRRHNPPIRHKSDCAVHDAPAYEAGACTCGADPESKAPR